MDLAPGGGVNTPSPISPPPPSEPLARPWWRELWVMLPVGLLLLYAGLRALTEERRALSQLEPGTRSQLFGETWRSFETLCRQPGLEPELWSRCAEQARFLLSFPECQDACRERLTPFRQGSR